MVGERAASSHAWVTQRVMRCYHRIMRNLVDLYLSLADRWHVWSSANLGYDALANSETHVISDVEKFLSGK